MQKRSISDLALMVLSLPIVFAPAAIFIGIWRWLHPASFWERLATIAGGVLLLGAVQLVLLIAGIRCFLDAAARIASRRAKARRDRRLAGIGAPVALLLLGWQAASAQGIVTARQLEQGSPTRAAVALGELQRLAVPAYPVAAERECISGVVTLEVTVRPDGRAGRIEVVRGHALLAAAAKATARRARWEVTTLNREPMERTAMLQFAFLLTRRRCGL